MTDTTTIEIEADLRDWLREIRESPESSYSDTLRRLRADYAGEGYVTASEARAIAEDVVAEEARQLGKEVHQ